MPGPVPRRRIARDLLASRRRQMTTTVALHVERRRTSHRRARVGRCRTSALRGRIPERHGQSARGRRVRDARPQDKSGSRRVRTTSATTLPPCSSLPGARRGRWRSFLGHTNASETSNTYAHLWPSDEGRVVAAKSTTLAGVTCAKCEGTAAETRWPNALTRTLQGSEVRREQAVDVLEEEVQGDGEGDDADEGTNPVTLRPAADQV